MNFSKKYIMTWQILYQADSKKKPESRLKTLGGASFFQPHFSVLDIRPDEILFLVFDILRDFYIVSRLDRGQTRENCKS